MELALAPQWKSGFSTGVMDDDNILQSLPLAECVEEDQVIDVIFDSTTPVPNDDRL